MPEALCAIFTTLAYDSCSTGTNSHSRQICAYLLPRPSDLSGSRVLSGSRIGWSRAISNQSTPPYKTSCRRPLWHRRRCSHSAKNDGLRCGAASPTEDPEPRHIANEDSEDARLTRDVVQSVMSTSRASTARASSEPSADAGDDSDSEESWVRELEREMEQGDTAEADNLPLNASRGAAAGASSEPPADGGDDSDEAWVRELELEMEQG